jgi:hypothetical protein
MIQISKSKPKKISILCTFKAGQFHVRSFYRWTFEISMGGGRGNTTEQAWEWEWEWEWESKHG